jgi:hypothetical protein
MNLTTVLSIIGGGLTAVIGAIISILTYRRSQIREAPALRLDSTRTVWHAASDSSPLIPSPEIKLTNSGAGLARHLKISVWLFMVTESQFAVPSDSDLLPHFAGAIDSLKPGESANPHLFRFGIPPEQSALPSYNEDAVPLTKVSVSYRDVFGKSLVERFVRAGKPVGFEVGGVSQV